MKTTATNTEAVAEKEEQQAVATTQSSEDAFAITDVYERSTDSDSSTVKNATYSNILSTVKAAKSAAATPASNAASSAVASTATQSASASNDSAVIASLSSSSEDSSEEEETTELIYNADGSVYEKTTITDEDGNETVTMTKVSDAVEKEDPAKDSTKEEIKMSAQLVAAE